MKLALSLLLLTPLTGVDAIMVRGDGDIIVTMPNHPPRFRCFPQRSHPITLRNGIVQLVGPLDPDFKIWAPEGLALVRVGGKWGYVDPNLKVQIPPKFDDVEYFAQGLAGVRVDDKWGYIDKVGRLVVKPQFEWVDSFHYGLGVVKKGGKYGLINSKGEWVLPPTYDAGIYPTEEGFEAVMFDRNAVDGDVTVVLDKHGRPKKTP